MNILYDTTNGNMELMNIDTNAIIFSRKMNSNILDFNIKDKYLFVYMEKTFEIYDIMSGEIVRVLNKNGIPLLYNKSDLFYSYRIGDSIIFEIELSSRLNNHMIISVYDFVGELIRKEDFSNSSNINFHRDNIFISQDNKILVFNSKFERIYEYSFNHNIDRIIFNDNIACITLKPFDRNRHILFLNIDHYNFIGNIELISTYTSISASLMNLIYFKYDKIITLIGDGKIFIYVINRHSFIVIDKTNVINMIYDEENNDNYVSVYYTDRIEIINLYSGLISDTIKLNFNIQFLNSSSNLNNNHYILTQNKHSELWIFNSISRTHGRLNTFNHFNNMDEKINIFRIIDGNYIKDNEISVDGLLDFF